MTKAFNKSSQKSKRRELRNNPTLAERTLWMSLRKRQIDDVRFLRQFSVNKFVLDFYAPDIKLCIEVDGNSHIGREQYDSEREKYLKDYGINVLRFTDEEVLGNADKTVGRLTEVVKRIKSDNTL